MAINTHRGFGCTGTAFGWAGYDHTLFFFFWGTIIFDFIFLPDWALMAWKDREIDLICTGRVRRIQVVITLSSESRRLLSQWFLLPTNWRSSEMCPQDASISVLSALLNPNHVPPRAVTLMNGPLVVIKALRATKLLTHVNVMDLRPRRHLPPAIFSVVVSKVARGWGS